MKILVAETAGFCWGVRRALDQAVDLAKKAEYYGIKKEWVELEIISIITTPSYGEFAAPFLVKKLKIASPKDTKQLEEAKELAYKEGFYQGIMNISDFKGEKVEIAFVDQGYTGDVAAERAQANGIQLEVVKHTEAKKGFVLLPRRWVVERSFGWLGRFRRLARDYERLTATLAGWHWLAFLTLLLPRLGFNSA